MWIWGYWGVIYLLLLLSIFGLAQLLSRVSIPPRSKRPQATLLGSNLNNLHIKVSTYKYEAIARKLANLRK